MSLDLDRISKLTHIDIIYIKQAELDRFEQVIGRCEVCGDMLPQNHSWVFAHTETKTAMSVRDRARKFVCGCIVLHMYETDGWPENLESKRCVQIYNAKYDPGHDRPFWEKYLLINGNWWER